MNARHQILRSPGRVAAGFTLVELLVVLIILGVVSTLGTTAFVTITDAWNEQKSLTDLDALAEHALQIIRTDISDVLSYELSGAALHGISRDFEDKRTFPAAHQPDDELSIPVQGTAPGRTLQIAAKVGYRVGRTQDDHALVRTVGSLDGGFPSTGRSAIIARARTNAFSVEYLSNDPERLWVDEWNQRELPSAIRVSLTLEDLNRPYIQISRKAVMHIHVR